jgi:microcystin-dependent protein
MMYYDGATDVVLVEEEGGTAFFHNHPPGEYVDVAYAVTAGLEPRGTLIADGVAVSRTTYSKLFAKLATTHGAGNGTTTFNKPDARGRDKVARDNQGGTTAGVIDAAYYGASVTANGTKGGFKGHTGGVGVSVSVSVSGSASGTVSVVTNSFSMDGPNSVHNASDQAINTFNAASDGHTHANVQSAGSTGATLGVGASGSGSGGTAAFTIMQPGIIVDTLITTGGQ